MYMYMYMVTRGSSILSQQEGTDNLLAGCVAHCSAHVPKVLQIRGFSVGSLLRQARLNHESNLGPLTASIANLAPKERKKSFGLEMTKLRCTALSSDESSSLQPSEDRIAAVKDEASKYLLGIIHEITNELEWDLRYMTKKFKDGLEESDFTTKTDAARTAFQALSDFAERTDLKSQIREKEDGLQVLEAGCLAELQKYFQGSKPAPPQNVKMAGA